MSYIDVHHNHLSFLLQKSLDRKELAVEGQLDFEEFVHYLQDYEKDLKLVVKSLDKKHSGETLGRALLSQSPLLFPSFNGVLMVVLYT